MYKDFRNLVSSCLTVKNGQYLMQKFKFEKCLKGIGANNLVAEHGFVPLVCLFNQTLIVQRRRRLRVAHACSARTLTLKI